MASAKKSPTSATRRPAAKKTTTPKTATPKAVTPKATAPTPSKSVSFAQLVREAKQLNWEAKKTTKGIVLTSLNDGISKITLNTHEDFEEWIDKQMGSTLENTSVNMEITPQEEATNREEIHDFELPEREEEQEAAIAKTEPIEKVVKENQATSKVKVDEDDVEEATTLLDKKTDSYFITDISLNPDTQAKMQDLADLCEVESADAWTKKQICRAFDLSIDIDGMALSTTLAVMGLTLKATEHPEIPGTAYSVYYPV